MQFGVAWLVGVTWVGMGDVCFLVDGWVGPSVSAGFRGGLAPVCIIYFVGA